MGTTSRFAFPYPEQTDIPDVQSDLKKLADSVDANLNVISPPVVNGQWLKGSGGAAVWSAIQPSDIGGFPNSVYQWLRGDGVWNAIPYVNTAYVISSANTDIGTLFYPVVYLPIGTGGGTLRSIGGNQRGSLITIKNTSGSAFTLKHQLAGGNQMLSLVGGVDKVLAPGQCVLLINDGTNWQEINYTLTNYGTSLPANPFDSMEATLVDSISNPSYQWNFRYNAQSTSAYKWECIGGNPITRFTGNQEATSSGTVVELTTQLRITCPREGDYVLGWGGAAYAPSAVTQANMVIYDETAAGIVSPTVYTFIVVNNTYSTISTGYYTQPGMSVNHVYSTRYNNGSANGVSISFSNRWFSMLPVRVK